eukprot:c21178_g1_i2 orf=375-2201(-)
MLPCSEMRLSFIGDNGEIERIAAVKSIVEDAHVAIEMLDADPAGRSFIVKLSGGKHFFWQSERSMMVGDELVAEMKDFLLRRPTLSQLTGVHESRLNSFVSQLRNNLAAASSSAGFQPSCTASSLSSTSSISLTNVAVMSPNPSSSCGIKQSPRLSPRVSGFKEGASRGLTNIRSFTSSREKHRRRLDKLNPASAFSVSNTHCRSCNMDIISDRSVAVCINQEEERIGSESDSVELNTLSPCMPEFCGRQSGNDTPCVPLVSASLPSPMLGGSSFSSNGLHLPIASHLQIPTSTLVAPYYCPCPLRSPALQYAFTPPLLPQVGELNNAPASPTFFSVKPSSTILSQTTLSLDRVSISPIPLPVSSLVNIPTPLQTSSLSSFFSDPIVHIPVVDFQSANKGFLVSAPPPVSSSGFPAVLPSFLSNILSGGERLIGGQEASGFSILQGLGIPCRSEDEHRECGDVHPFLINSRFITRRSDDHSAKDCVEQMSDSCWSASSSSELDRFPEFSGPLLGMVPAILTSGSLSCVLNFHQERNTAASTWVSGSRGLYGGSCEPGISAPSITACSTSIGVRIRGTDVLQRFADRMDSLINGSSKDTQNEEEASKTD